MYTAVFVPAYRLSCYWYPFRKSHVSVHPVTGVLLPYPSTGKPQVIVEDGFRPGTTFQQIMDLYVFDKRLRLLFLDALERVEIALRVDIALLIGVRDPWAHRDPSQLHGQFSKEIHPKAGQSEYQKWLVRLDGTYSRSKDEFVEHFKRKYGGEHPPIWIAVELRDFEMLSVFLGGMKYADRITLAAKYSLPPPELLTSWIRSLNQVRNICRSGGQAFHVSTRRLPQLALRHGGSSVPYATQSLLSLRLCRRHLFQ